MPCLSRLRLLPVELDLESTRRGRCAIARGFFISNMKLAGRGKLAARLG